MTNWVRESRGGADLRGHFFFGEGAVAGGEEIGDVAMVGLYKFEFVVDEGEDGGDVEEGEGGDGHGE